MDERTELLERLRIDRSAPTHLKTTVSRGRWLLGIAIVVVVLVVAGAGWYLDDAENAVQIRTATAVAVRSTARGPMMGRTLLDASGYVVAVRQAAVSANSIYKVREVLVQAGDRVKQGQIIARLDDSNVHATLDQSKAQVKQLEATLSAAKLAAIDIHPGFLRNQKQLKEGLISQDAFDTAKGNDDAAQAAIAVAEEGLAVARTTVAVNQKFEDDTVIRAPFNGVVTIKSAQPGQIVSPQFSGGGGVATIVDMDSLEVDVDVSENFISRVHVNQPAAITLNAYPDWHIPAEVVAIVPTADRSKATVEVRVGFKEKDARVLPEMGARVSFVDDTTSGEEGSSPTFSTAVLVPQDSVQTEGDTAAVFVVDGRTVHHRVVQLGQKGSTGQTILSGLESGATVAIGDFSKLHDGARIKVIQ